MPTARTVLLADADVLIDYRESELGILELVVEHVGRVAVLAPVLGEVRGVTAAQCGRLGIEVVEVETERMLQAADVDSRHAGPSQGTLGKLEEGPAARRRSEAWRPTS